MLQIFKPNVCCKCGRLLDMNLIKFWCRPTSTTKATNFVIRKKFEVKRRIAKYGLLTLSTIGSGLIFMLSSPKEELKIEETYDNVDLTNIFQDIFHHKAEEDDINVGIEQDWQLYSKFSPELYILSRLQIFFSELVHFDFSKIWGWLFPWEKSKSDDPWTLLELTKSHNFWIRQMGIASLASKVDWPEYKYRNIAQACDARVLVALARYPYASQCYFLPQPKLHASKNDIVKELRDQLKKLPLPHAVNSCLMYFRFLALDQDFLYNNDPFNMDIINYPYSFPEDEEKKKEKDISNCLQAILSYTAEPDHAINFVCNHGLAVLQHLCEDFSDNWIQMYVASILTNLSLIPDLLNSIVQAGWLRVLRQWINSSDTALSLQALTVLANLDRDWWSKELYQDVLLIHPTQRNSPLVYADVVLVHGLRGGVVKTWRQRDDIHKTSACWPKDWLAQDCPNIRIISIGYESKLHKWGDHCPYEQDKRTIEGRSREIIKKLQKAGVGSRPIIWVGHSMGGLLIKKIITIGETEDEFKKLAAQTKGLLFYSVPHHGSSVVDAIMYAKYLLFPSVEVQELHSSSPKLAALHDNFVKFVQKNSVPCLSFGENVKTTFGRPLPKLLVVPSDSSDPGVGKFVTLPNNHIETCKPCSQDDVIYQLTCNFIKNILISIKQHF
ncbi:protein SERAC1-like isoform X1 [Biomphalaria glabrata]|uniref:Protein SERAC1 n=2 Tax=Biomphalaria glabrata TaxID=6526 RepID=A0A9U8EHQ9_BIOGL|nr:protein SERAC1-like isoform X1 [Biomphalaria glabrata]